MARYYHHTRQYRGYHDLRDFLDDKHHREGESNGRAPDDPPSILHDTLRGDAPLSSTRPPHDSYRGRGRFQRRPFSYLQRGRGRTIPRGQTSRGMPLNPINIKVEFSAESGERKCLIDLDSDISDKFNNTTQGRPNFRGRGYRGNRRGRGNRGTYYNYAGRPKSDNDKRENSRNYYQKRQPRYNTEQEEEDWNLPNTEDNLPNTEHRGRYKQADRVCEKTEDVHEETGTYYNYAGRPKSDNDKRENSRNYYQKRQPRYNTEKEEEDWNLPNTEHRGRYKQADRVCEKTEDVHEETGSVQQEIETGHVHKKTDGPRAELEGSHEESESLHEGSEENQEHHEENESYTPDDEAYSEVNEDYHEEDEIYQEDEYQEPEEYEDEHDDSPEGHQAVKASQIKEKANTSNLKPEETSATKVADNNDMDHIDLVKNDTNKVKSEENISDIKKDSDMKVKEASKSTEEKVPESEIKKQGNNEEQEIKNNKD